MPGASLRAGAGALSFLTRVPVGRVVAVDGSDVARGAVMFPLVGAGVGALSSIVVTTGPVATPFFLAYGLRRAAYIGTESVCTMAMHFTRGAVFARYALLTWDMVALGCVLGASMFFGTWAARRLLDRMSERVFLWIVEGLLVVMGLQSLLFPR